MKSLVSILVPAFNAERWIADTLRSALNQTWPRKEIIVVDDGSTDQTAAIAQRFAAEGVTVVRQENQGAAVARNKAFALSRGDYIQWLDADDLLSPDKITKQMAVAESCHGRRTLLSSSWGRFIYRYYRAEFTPTGLWCDLSPAEWLSRKMEQNLYMQTATWLVSRELTESAGPWDSRLLGDDDGEYFCRVLLGSDGVRFVPEAKVYYRMPGRGSLSYIGQSVRKMDAQFRSMELHIGYLRSMEESDRIRAACVKYLQNWMFNFYPDRLDIVERAKRLATELGGRLEAPPVSRRYSWLAELFGLTLVKRVRLTLSHTRWSLVRSWDKALFLSSRILRRDIQVE